MSMSTLAFKKAARSRCQPLRRHSYESDVLSKHSGSIVALKDFASMKGAPALSWSSTPHLAPAGIANAEPAPYLL